MPNVKIWLMDKITHLTKRKQNTKKKNLLVVPGFFCPGPKLLELSTRQHLHPVGPFFHSTGLTRQRYSTKLLVEGSNSPIKSGTLRAWSHAQGKWLAESGCPHAPPPHHAAPDPSCPEDGHLWLWVAAAVACLHADGQGCDWTGTARVASDHLR